MKKELVRVLRLHPEIVEGIRWEISEVCRDDDISTAANGGCEDMAITRIGKMQPLNEMFISGDQRVDGVCRLVRSSFSRIDHFARNRPVIASRIKRFRSANG